MTGSTRAGGAGGQQVGREGVCVLARLAARSLLLAVVTAGGTAAPGGGGTMHGVARARQFSLLGFAYGCAACLLVSILYCGWEGAACCWATHYLATYYF